MDEAPLQPQRKWYQKKRYIIPLSLFGFAIISGVFNDSSAPTTNYVQDTNQVQSISIPALTPQVQEQTPVLSVPQQIEDEDISSFNEENENVPLSNDNTYINSRGNEVHSPAYAPSVPPGATAICGDGTYSFSQNRRGTCSHHGGVAEWL